MPYPRNARTHSEDQVAQIAASIREYGWTNPLLIDEHDEIIAGHGRLMAARKLEMVEVPCIVLSGLTANQKRALVIADNKLALNAGWDKEMLGLELQDLKDLGCDLSSLGFDQAELEQFLKPSAGLTDLPTINMGEELVFRIVVQCSDEADQAKLLERLEKDGYKCQLLMS